MKRIILVICVGLLTCSIANAQSWLERIGKRTAETVKNKVEERIDNKAAEATEKTMDKAEESVKGKKGKSDKNEVENEELGIEKDSSPKKVSLESYSNYDFVPGDQILYFEDFSRDAIGDFPATWTTNSTGEVKKVNIASGNWFHLNGEDATYCYINKIDFPENFIVEFDIIPDRVYDWGITLTLYDEEEFKEFSRELYPGKYGLHITIDDENWTTKGYNNQIDIDYNNGKSVHNTVQKEQVNHVIIWIQKRRVRIYHEGAKVLDIPTNIHSGIGFTRMRFSGWDSKSWPMISNLKVTTASPDTRSKIITEGKMITYGITFDVNKANIKPESYGTLNSIASVLKENPDVRIKIVGHTDSDGDDALNMSLSQQRAESVKKELVKSFKIDASRMETEGAGESQPITSNDTSENKAKNRRVELIKI